MRQVGAWAGRGPKISHYHCIIWLPCPVCVSLMHHGGCRVQRQRQRRQQPATGSTSLRGVLLQVSQSMPLVHCVSVNNSRSGTKSKSSRSRAHTVEHPCSLHRDSVCGTLVHYEACIPPWAAAGLRSVLLCPVCDRGGGNQGRAPARSQGKVQAGIRRGPGQLW